MNKIENWAVIEFPGGVPKSMAHVQPPPLLFVGDVYVPDGRKGIGVKVLYSPQYLSISGANITVRQGESRATYLLGEPEAGYAAREPNAKEKLRAALGPKLEISSTGTQSNQWFPTPPTRPLTQAEKKGMRGATPRMHVCD